MPGGPLPLYGTADCSTLLDNGRNCMPVDPTDRTGVPWQCDPGRPLHEPHRASRSQAQILGAPTVANQPEGIANFTKGYAGALTTNQQTYRGDQNLGKLGSVFGRYTYSKYVNHSLYNSGSLDYGIEVVF